MLSGNAPDQGVFEKFRAAFDIGQKEHFFKKRAPKNPPPYSIPSLSAFHRNKALCNFSKRGKGTIVECNKGLQYALPVASNSYISTTLSDPVIMSFKFLKHFFSGKISYYFRFACLP